MTQPPEITRYGCKRCGGTFPLGVDHSCEPEYPEGHDPVHHPTHYTSHPSGVECIQITEHLSFCVGNAIKYLWRADQKNGIEDLEKAAWYIDREIKRRRKWVAR